MATLAIAVSGRTDNFHQLRYRLLKKDSLHLDYHLVRDPYQLALWLGLKTHRDNDPTRLIRADLSDSIF